MNWAEIKGTCQLPNGKHTSGYGSYDEALQELHKVRSETGKHWQGYRPILCRKCQLWHVLKSGDEWGP